MRSIKKRHHSVLNLPTLRLEGGLFLPDQLEKAALGQANYQTEADYQTPKGLKLKDDFSRAFQIATAQWKHFAPSLDRKDQDAASVTTEFVKELLRDALAYVQFGTVAGITLDERHYPINALLNDNIPLVIAPHNLDLDEADFRFAIVGSSSRKKSAFQLAQEFLNASADHLWAIVTNGRQLRLLRDAATLTRPSYLEFDLQDMLGAQRFAEFEMVWRLLHASRAGVGQNASVWETWRAEGQQEGTRVRDGLRQGVTDALLTLGTGFIQHPANEALRIDLLEGRLSKDAYFQQLLRLVYRFIFLFTVEERGVLHTDDDSKEAIAARRVYAEGYALARLRDRCLRRRSRNQFDDIWSGLKIVFRGLAEGQPMLALPALGGLFGNDQCPNFDIASLSNAALMDVMKQLRWSNFSGNLAPVDYRNMGPEELGSVYESLLEMVPEADIHARTFCFIRGNTRKETGSYYTPDSLVQELIKSALDPVIEQRLAARPDKPTEALLAIRVIDPACGSGHFLLAAARRLGERLAALRATDGAVKPQDYRHALREVIARCIFGVDRNPMALELARTALWLEGFEEGKPLSFLDHHLQVGDALLGLTDLQTLSKGVARDAFKPLSGDNKETCKALAKTNAAGLKQLERDLQRRQLLFRFDESTALNAYAALEALPAETTVQIAAKAAAYQTCLHEAQDSRMAHAANLLLGAYLLPKYADNSEHIPTSATVYLELMEDQRSSVHQQQLAAAQAACEYARVLHWPLRFPQVFVSGGFDCVLGNPPWERIKLQEEEFFATRHIDVAQAKNKAERSQRIQWLSEGMLARHLLPEMEHPAQECEAETRLYGEFISARRVAEAASLFAHVKGDDGGRYPLTGVGDVNTYALFAETISQITAESGRAGFIVPTGIATDDTTKAFFSDITQHGKLVSIQAFENEEFIFSAVHHSFRFCLLTLGKTEQAEFVFFARRPDQIHDARRRFRLTPEEFRLINPNTLTCPVFRSERDAELTKKLYRRTPTLIADGLPDGNPWGISFMRMFDMSNDSHLFADSAAEQRLPLYEGKMVQAFDHRAASVELNSTNIIRPGQPYPTTLIEHENPNFAVRPQYWVAQELVRGRTPDFWQFRWLLAFKSVTSPTNERTFISVLLPESGVAHSMVVIMPYTSTQSATAKNIIAQKIVALYANFNVLVVDFVARTKVGGLNMSLFFVRQFPVLPPEAYSEADLAFIVPRVLELTYTAHDMKLWAHDLGYEGEPFAFHPERRAILRAELDAYYARLYDLTRDELRYILDPADVLGADYPSETFRVLKNNEMREFGEYRTQRLVLTAWDKLESGELH